MSGFAKPTTTQTPDALLDYWLTRLTGSELRVLLYAVRRTYGFKRDEDAIGLEQFLHGITTREGTVLDAGIGISRSALLGAIKSLSERGLLLKARRVGDDGRDTVSTYRLSVVDERHGPADQGLRDVNTTQVPDEIFDYWLPRLSDAELKVLLYIVRRTLGFRKQADAIKPAQFLAGVTSRSGEQLDDGCGVSQKHLYRALGDLQEKGLITVRRRVSEQVGNQASVFTLVFENDVPALLRATADLDPRARDYRLDDEAAVSTHPHPEPPIPLSRKDTEGEQKGHRGGSEKTQSPRDRPDSGEQKRRIGGPEKTQREVRKDLKDSVSKMTPQQTDVLIDRQQTDSFDIESKGPAPLADDDHADPENDQEPPDGLVERRIRSLVSEFGDASSPRSSITKAVRSFHDSGCSVDDFLGLLDHAAGLVRRYRPAKPMPYLFITLDDLVRGIPLPLGRTTASVEGTETPAIDEPNVVWRAVLEEIRTVITAENFALWFATTRVVAQEGDVLRVMVPTAFNKGWLEHKLHGRIAGALARLGYEQMRVDYVVATQSSDH